jgi:hypothetical protein
MAGFVRISPSKEDPGIWPAYHAGNQRVRDHAKSSRSRLGVRAVLDTDQTVSNYTRTTSRSHDPTIPRSQCVEKALRKSIDVLMVLFDLDGGFLSTDHDFSSKASDKQRTS